MDFTDYIKIHGPITVLVDIDDTIANYSSSMVKALPSGDKNISVDVIEGAFEALNEMESEGITVFIVSSPAIGNETCHSDKSAWLWEQFGERWSRRLVLTKDKTIVRGDVLIDDRTDVVGAMEPTWKHVLFSQPHNEHIDDERLHLDGWENWRPVLERAMGFV